MITLSASFVEHAIQFFRKVGRSASEEVTIQLLKTKCLPVLYCGLEAWLANRDQVRSLDYAIHNCLRKIVLTSAQSIIEECMMYFECHPVHNRRW